MQLRTATGTLDFGTDASEPTSQLVIRQTWPLAYLG